MAGQATPRSRPCGDQVATPLLPWTLGPPSSSMVISSPIASGTTLGPGQEHPRVLGHHDEVGQRRRVGAAAGGDAGEDRDLRHLARQLDAGAEDAAVAGEGGVALLQAGAAGADEADHRGAARRRPSASCARSCRRGPRRGCRRGRPGPGRNRRPAGRRLRRRPRRRRPRASPARPSRGGSTPLRSGRNEPGSQSICEAAERRRPARTRAPLACLEKRRWPHVWRSGRGRRCGRRTRTSWRSRRRGPSPFTIGFSGPRPRSRDRDPLRPPHSSSVGGAFRVGQGIDRGDRLDRAGGAEQVADRRLGRGLPGCRRRARRARA